MPLTGTGNPRERQDLGVDDGGRDHGLGFWCTGFWSVQEHMLCKLLVKELWSSEERSGLEIWLRRLTSLLQCSVEEWTKTRRKEWMSCRVEGDEFRGKNVTGHSMSLTASRHNIYLHDLNRDIYFMI